MEITLSSILLLLAAGLIAGVINTLAGGGSNLTLPALMMLGLPADIANGTSRVAIVFQCMVAVKGFDKHNSLDRPAIVPILIPTVLGGILGAVFAAVIPVGYLKPVLLLTILSMSAIILLRPTVLSPPEGTPILSPTDSNRGWWGLFGAGLYGGFVQAGVGFILLAALAGILRYDLKRANALKMACTLAFTSVALLVFIAFDQVMWVPGLILAMGSMTGAHFAVKIAINASQNTIKWFLFAMTIAAVIGGFVL
jgi:uncharacterized membrane protein YfcA